MTGPRLDVLDQKRPHIPTGAEWEQSQYITGAAARGLAEGAPPKTSGISRIPTGEEWQRSQSLSGPAVKAMQLPALPQIAIAPRDATSTARDNTKGKPLAPFDIADPTTYANPVLRQLVGPALENPFSTAALGLAPLAIGPAAVSAVLAAGATASTAAAIGTGVNVATAGAFVLPMVHTIAQYGWQKAHELVMDPDARKLAESDPARVSGEAAAVQAVMLGLAPLVHVALKRARIARYAGDVPLGPTEAPPLPAPMEIPLGERGRLSRIDPAGETGRFAASLEDGANLRIPTEAPHPEGFTIPAGVKLKGQPRRVGGYAPNNPFNEVPSAGKVAPTETQAPADVLQTTADQLNDPMRPRRRAQPAQNFFEHPTGAETLGAAAGRHGLPETANPYHPDDPNAPYWQEGHTAATESFAAPGSFPEGFSMGGALTENRIPADYAPPKTPGFEPTALPDGVTPETAALADALKPNRYRAHTKEALAESLLDAQKAIEDAQTAYHASTQRGLVGEAAQADLENRGSSYSNEHEFAAKSAKRVLDAAKATAAQIERELTLRGVRGDELADVMKDAHAARDERAGMQQQDQLDALSGTESISASSGLAPVPGTGEVKTRGLSVGVERKALANKLTTGLGALPEYTTVDMADQARLAGDLMETNLVLARSVALGESPAPHGLLPESVFVAVENRAIAEGDVATIRDLATGKLTSEATMMGQRIRALGERDPESPVAAIKSVLTVRMGGAKNVPRATEETIASIRAQLAKMDITQDAWAKFVDSLRC